MCVCGTSGSSRTGSVGGGSSLWWGRSWLGGHEGSIVCRGEGGDCHREEGVWVDWDHPHAHARLREMWGSAGKGKLDRGNLLGEGDWNLCCSW